MPQIINIFMLRVGLIPTLYLKTFEQLPEKFKKSSVSNTIVIPLPLCFSCFVALCRFQENLTKPFYFYRSRTCDSPGDNSSVIRLALIHTSPW